MFGISFACSCLLFSLFLISCLYRIVQYILAYLYLFKWNFEWERFIVVWVQGAFFDTCLLFLQAFTILHQCYLDIGICERNLFFFFLLIGFDYMNMIETMVSSIILIIFIINGGGGGIDAKIVDLVCWREGIVFGCSGDDERRWI